MSEPKALLVLHGKQVLNDDVRSAVEEQRRLGWNLAVRVTWEAGDSQRIVREALAAGYPTIIAGGGDGTVRDIAEAMVLEQAEASLAIMPLGTANDFARAAGIPLQPDEALALLDEPPVPIDVGEVNGQIFLNMATGGFGSRVTASTSEDLKKVLGGGAYLLTGLTRFAEVSSAWGHFRAPGFEWQGDFLALGIGNGRQAGGGQLLCPHAQIDDGLLDVCIVPAPADAVGTLSTLLNGGLRGLESVSISTRVPWIELDAPEAIDINLDGEPTAAEALRISLREHALRVHLPPGCPLLLAYPDPVVPSDD